jgi:uncharacterized protein YjiS (DUF1127 family)
MRHEAFDIGSIDVRSLNPKQRDALRRHLIREAHAVRARAIRWVLVRAFGLLRWLPIAAMQKIYKGWIVYRRRRDRLEGWAQLRAMTDYELRDIGISRSAIRGAVCSDEKDETLRSQCVFKVR